MKMICEGHKDCREGACCPHKKPHKYQPGICEDECEQDEEFVTTCRKATEQEKILGEWDEIEQMMDRKDKDDDL